MNNKDYKKTSYTITLDPTPQHHKPSKPEFGCIVNNLKLVTGLTINQFITYVSQPYGYTWSGGLFNGGISNANWLQQQVFGIDFDNGTISINEVLERLNKIEVFPQLWYSTFSDSDSIRKFRVVLFLDEPVKEESVRKVITTALLGLFPEADTQCKNAGRIFLGGKDANFISEEPISTSKLIEILSCQLISMDGGRTRKIPASTIGTTINSRYMDTGTKQSFVYNKYRKEHSVPIFKIKTTSLNGGGEVIDIDVARQRVRIFNEFLNGEWLDHKQLFGLATNLYYVRGGRKLMNETMQHFNELGKTFYTENNFNINTYLSKVQYPPIPIYSFSTYSDDHDINDLVSATKDIRGLIDQIEPIKRLPLNEAETLFKSKFKEVIEDNIKGKIHLFILPTAIGKTQSITSTIGTIAAPTNSLKEEIFNRMTIPCITTPDAVVFDSQQLNKKISYYYSIGLPKKATAVLYDVINEKNDSKYTASDIEKASDYLTKLKASYQTNMTVLTTHARALHSDFWSDSIIFDEDPLNSLIDIKMVRISDIQKLDNQTKLLNNDLDNIIDYLKSTTPTEIISTPTFSVNIDLLIEKVAFSSIETNIFEFFNSSFLIKDNLDHDLIHYVVRRQIPMNKKVIILSATLPLCIYEKLYGDRLNIIDIRDVEQVGSVIQFTKRSCSRHSLNWYVTDISKNIGTKPVITFKSFSHQFQNPVEGMHFGNCSGYDSMKGKDLVVVGTPHSNNIKYFLTAKVMGIDFKTTETTMGYQKIEYNGFRFMFYCFDKLELRKIQLALIESDLVQAVGRARTLRTNATVELYSNFPLRISDEFIY